MTLLICAAFAPEIELLQEETARGWMTAILGVGPVSAASTIASVLERHDISHILFTGTCGALPTSLAIGDIVRAKTVHLGDLGIFNRTTWIPDTMPTAVTPARFLVPPQSLPERDVFCPLAITVSDPGMSLLHQRFPGGVVENLECFAVAWNAFRRNIPFDAILGVSNFIGPDEHAEWARHHVDVSRATQLHIRKLLGS